MRFAQENNFCEGVFSEKKFANKKNKKEMIKTNFF